MSALVSDVNALVVQQGVVAVLIGTVVRSVDSEQMGSDDFIRANVTATHGSVNLPLFNEFDYSLLNYSTVAVFELNSLGCFVFRAALSSVNMILNEIQFVHDASYYAPLHLYPVV